MSRKKKKDQSSAKKFAPSPYPELDKLVHQGTAESLKKIDEYIRKCDPGEKRDFAEMAREEAEFWYYWPHNEKDEKQYALARIIRKKENSVSRFEIKIMAAEAELKRLAWEKSIHEKLMKKLDAKRREEWKYNFSEDYAFTVKQRLAELKDSADYDKAWIAEAHKMITLKKYADVPDRVFASIFSDDDLDSCWDDDDESEEEKEDDDCPSCPHCGSDDVMPELNEIPF
jgi:hypothetical protein